MNTPNARFAQAGPTPIGNNVFRKCRILIRPARLFPIFLLLISLTNSELIAATIRGKIETQENLPIARVTVALHSRDLGPNVPPISSVTTAADGTFQLQDIPPATYRLVAQKPGWVDAEITVAVSADQADGEVEVRLPMDLTLRSQVVARLRMGILAYVLVLGLLVLVANYWVAPVPSREVTVFGWVFVVASVLISCVKLLWIQALVLVSLGVPLGWLIQRYGGKAASLRMDEQEKEKKKQDDDRRAQRERLEAVTGQEGITLSNLKPCGTASIDGEVVEVRAQHGFIPKDTPVVVKKIEGGMPVVDVRG
jgi:hypothetical protein